MQKMENATRTESLLNAAVEGCNSENNYNSLEEENTTPHTLHTSLTHELP